MGEIRLFQICYEGELTLAVSRTMRRLGAEPNFDQSWQVWLPEGRHAAPLVRYIRANLDDESRLLVVVVATQLRLDPNLASQRDRVHGGGAALGQPEAEHDRRHSGVRLRARAEHLELEGAHRARARTSSKNESIASRASCPPSKPRQSLRNWPTSS